MQSPFACIFEFAWQSFSSSLCETDWPARSVLILLARAHLRRRDDEAETVLDAPLPRARQEHDPSPCGAEMPEDLETEGLEQRGQQAWGEADARGRRGPAPV